jgi:hypothetical protein
MQEEASEEEAVAALTVADETANRAVLYDLSDARSHRQ